MKKLNPIFTLILILISALTLYAKDNNSAKIEINVADPKVKAQIFKANNFIGYKGDITIKVESYKLGYGGNDQGGKNVGITYKAYIDMTSTDNQKVIFYKSAHAPQLEYSLINGKLKVIHNGQDITKIIKTHKNFFTTYQLYKYPYGLISDMLTSEDFYAKFKEYYALFGEIDLNATIQNYYEMSASKNDYFVVLDVNNKYEITGLSIEDNSDFYTWKNNTPHKIACSRMTETTTTTFLNEKGWVKK